MKYFFTTIALGAGILVSFALTQPNAAVTDSAGEAGCRSEMQSAMMKMHDAMNNAGQSPDCDEAFVRLMLPHHQGAIDMAKTELLYGKDPALRRLAQEIITSQESEIELMRLWLQNRKNADQKPETGGTP